MANWKEIKDKSSLQEVFKQSFDKDIIGIVLFKHSTRCPVSAMAKMRFELGWDFPPDIPTYLIKVVEYREVSNEIESQTGVRHESPQLLLLQNGKVTYSVSHGAILVNQLKKQLAR